MCGGVLYERYVRRDEVDDGEGDTAPFEAVEDAVFARDGWEDQELDKASYDAVHGEEGSDSSRAETKAAGELEGEVGVELVWDLFRVMKEDGEELIICYRVKSEK